MELIEEDSEILGRKIIIEYLRIQVNTHRGNFSNGELVYINRAKYFFKNALKGLTAIIENKDPPNWINRDALWFYEALTGEKIIPEKHKEKIEEVIAEIKKSRKRLNNLVKIPIESQTNGNSKELANFIEKLYASYPEKLYDFL